MSEGDFEVLPRGTTEELRVLRGFVNEILALSAIHDMPIPHEMRAPINRVSRFYSEHVEKYPSL